MHPMKDKRARLRVAARYIKTGVVKFPRKGAEQLITQLLGFGSEKHDDAVDALCQRTGSRRARRQARRTARCCADRLLGASPNLRGSIAACDVGRCRKP